MPEEITGQGPISGLTPGPSVDAAPAKATTETDPAPRVDGPAPTTETKGAGPATKAPTPQADTETVRFLTLDDIEDENIKKAVEGILGPREKQMMSAYTKKTQEISTRKQDLEIMDHFRTDPVGTLQAVARQHGLQIVDPRQPGNTGTVTNQTQSNPLSDPNWEPKTYQELGQVIISQAVDSIIERLGPVLQPLAQNVEKISSTHIEQQLDGIDPNWRIYEDEVKSNMTQHPTLIKGHDGIKKLYRLSVPEEVYTSKAVQAAIAKMDTKAASIKTGSKSSTTHTAPAQNRVGSFADAVAAARESLNGR